jgi:hypothetical protein
MENLAETPDNFNYIQLYQVYMVADYHLITIFQLSISLHKYDETSCDKFTSMMRPVVISLQV